VAPKRRRKVRIARLSVEELEALKEKKAAKKVAKNPSASTAAKRGGKKMAKLRGAKKAAFLKRMAAGRRKAAKKNPPKAKKVKKATRKAPRKVARKAAPKKAVKKTVRRRKPSLARKAARYHIKTVVKSKSGKRRSVKRRPQVVTFVRTSRKAKRKPYGLAIHTVSRKTKKGIKRVRKPGLFKAYRNPDFKAMLIQGGMLWAGITGMKVINNLLGKYVVSKFKDTLGTSPTMVKVAGMLPSAIGFVAAAFAGKVIKGQPKLVEGIQVGATFQLLEQAFKAFVQPNLPAGAVAEMFSGVGEYLPLQGGMGYGEYLQPRQQMLGAPVQEALALGEYVSGFGGNGFDVEEALADSEANGLQTGYAGGSLSRTVFSS